VNKNITSIVPENIHAQLKKIAKRDGGNYVQLKQFVKKISRISLRVTKSEKNASKRDKVLENLKTLKNTIFIPTIPSRKAMIEKDYTLLKNWDYWALEIDKDKLNTDFLCNWLNQEIPKQQIISLATSGSFIKHITLKSLDGIYIIYHPLDQQISFNKNTETIKNLENKIKSLKEENVFNPVSITVDEVISQIPDLEFQNLITIEESINHEYKSSIRYSLKEKKQVKHLAEAALKVIVSFLNTTGGHLVIGIDDNKKLIGIEIDKFASIDEWIRFTTDKISSQIGKSFLGKYIQIGTKKFEDKTVAIIKCEKVPNDNWATLEDKIFIREPSRTRELKPAEVAEWMKLRLQNKN